MTAAAIPPAARVRPFGLARADLLKLRKRRGLFWTTAGLIVGPMVIAYGISAVVSVAASGDLPRPSATLVVESGLWVFAELAFYSVLAVGLASLTGSRAYTIGILLAWRTAVSHILVSISALGVYRKLLPDVPFDRLAPSAVEEFVRDAPSHIGISVPTSIGVLLLWAAVLTALGAWRTVTRDA